jgi:hypothetical protein
MEMLDAEVIHLLKFYDQTYAQILQGQMTTIEMPTKALELGDTLCLSLIDEHKNILEWVFATVVAKVTHAKYPNMIIDFELVE